MTLKKINLAICCLMILLGITIPDSPKWAQSITPLKLDANRIPWSQLSFHAKNFWVEVSTDIQLRSLAVSELDAVLIATPQGVPVKPHTSQTSELTINTTIDPSFRSPVKIHNRTWFDPTDASALGCVRLRRGEDDFKKMYRFTEKGIFRHRREPMNKNETSLAPEKWTDVKNSFYPYNLTQPGCSVITERSLLIYILSALNFSKINRPTSLCVFGKRQLHQVQLQKSGIHPITVNYVVKNQQPVVRKEITAKALKIEITSKPMESNLKSAENFSFMGFRNDIFIYIDPASQLPVQVSGNIPTVGKTYLKLRECQTKR